MFRLFYISIKITVFFDLVSAIYNPVVNMCTTCFNNQYLCILPTECIYGFHMILRVNRDDSPKQSYPIGLCNGEVLCFL
jgi:hypothetical protein